MEVSIQTVISTILNKWAVAVQISTILVISITFVALWKKFPRKIAFVWMKAWLLNFLGLCSIFAVLMLADKESIYLSKFIYLIYAYCKIWYSLYLIIGLNHYSNTDTFLKLENIPKWQYISITVLLFILISPLTTLHIQLIVYVIVGSILVIVGLNHCKDFKKDNNNFLYFALLFEGLLFLQHAYVLYPTLWGGSYPSYMTHVSFFDSIVELIVGIACLFAIVYEIIDEIQYSNRKMEKAQDSLRQLVDIDPLTGLWNRRKLPIYLDEINCNSTLIYIDINDFKAINDTLGHNIGDLCLKRIASSMVFLTNNQAGMFRLGGDEFLVVIPQKSELKSSAFITKLQGKLLIAQKETPAISIAIGTAQITAKTPFETAIEHADAQMYKSKKKIKK